MASIRDIYAVSTLKPMSINGDLRYLQYYVYLFPTCSTYGFRSTLHSCSSHQLLHILLSSLCTTISISSYLYLDRPVPVPGSTLPASLPEFHYFPIYHLAAIPGMRYIKGEEVQRVMGEIVRVWWSFHYLFQIPPISLISDCVPSSPCHCRYLAPLKCNSIWLIITFCAVWVFSGAGL